MPHFWQLKSVTAIVFKEWFFIFFKERISLPVIKLYIPGNTYQENFKFFFVKSYTHNGRKIWITGLFNPLNTELNPICQ